MIMNLLICWLPSWAKELKHLISTLPLSLYLYLLDNFEHVIFLLSFYTISNNWNKFPNPWNKFSNTWKIFQYQLPLLYLYKKMFYHSSYGKLLNMVLLVLEVMCAGRYAFVPMYIYIMTKAFLISQRHLSSDWNLLTNEQSHSANSSVTSYSLS